MFNICTVSVDLLSQTASLHLPPGNTEVQLQFLNQQQHLRVQSRTQTDYRDTQHSYKETWNYCRHMQNNLEDTQDNSRGDYRDTQSDTTVTKDTKQPQRRVEGPQRDLNDHRNKQNNYKEMWNDNKDDKDGQNGKKGTWYDYKETQNNYKETYNNEIFNIATNRWKTKTQKKCITETHKTDTWIHIQYIHNFDITSVEQCKYYTYFRTKRHETTTKRRQMTTERFKWSQKQAK